MAEKKITTMLVKKIPVELHQKFKALASLKGMPIQGLVVELMEQATKNINIIVEED